MILKTDKPIDDAFIIDAVRKKLDDIPRLNRLHNYYIGKHDILLRVQNDSDKPNNRIVVNYCRPIADILTSYLVGVPVKYNDAPQIILDNLDYNDNDEITQSVVLNMNIFGFGTELFYTDADSIPRFTSIDPREAIFVIDDTVEENLIAFIRVYPKINDTNQYNVIVYTYESYTQYNLSLSVGELKAAGKAQPHFWGDVPAIMYSNNRELMGAFENVLSLQDALNKLVSDEINDWEAFVDSYLVLTGLQATQQEDIAKMKKDRVLLMDGEAAASWLVKQVDNSHIRELKENITNKIRELGNIPNIEDLGSFGSSGVAIKFKLIPTEIQASKQERTVYKGIQRKLELLYNIFKLTNNSLGNYTDVKPEFERNFIMLSNDKINEKNVDLNLVASGLMSETTFLIKHEDMTFEEAMTELEQVEAEKYIGAQSDMSGFSQIKQREVSKNEFTAGTATGTGTSGG